VTGVSPTQGSALGGTTVTITGTNLTLASTVDFGTTAVTTGLTINTAGTSLTVKSPAGTGTVPVKVVTPSGTSLTSSSDQFSYVAPPTVTGISPATGGPLAGGTLVTISGTNLSTATAVDFGKAVLTSGQFTVNANGTLTVTSPTCTLAGASSTSGNMAIQVVTPIGTSATSSADLFSYVPVPAVTSITLAGGGTPAEGSTGGGTSVTITVIGYVSGATTLWFGTDQVTILPADVTIVTASTSTELAETVKITVPSPAHTAGNVFVTVVTPGGTSAGNTMNQFTYIATT
jgi:hypothetical protein